MRKIGKRLLAMMIALGMLVEVPGANVIHANGTEVSTVAPCPTFVPNVKLQNADVTQESTATEEFEVKDGVLVKYKGTSASVTVPSDITEIGNGAFANCKNLESVIILGNVVTVGERAFYGCTALNGVVFQTGLKSVEKWAFYGCTALENVVFPEGMEKIGELAFYNCSSLKSVTIPSSVTTIESSAMSRNNNSPELVIKGYVGSTAEKYAEENEIEFVDVLVDKEEEDNYVDVLGALYGFSYDTGVYSVTWYTEKGKEIDGITIPVYSGGKGQCKKIKKPAYKIGNIVLHVGRARYCTKKKKYIDSYLFYIETKFSKSKKKWIMGRSSGDEAYATIKGYGYSQEMELSCNFKDPNGKKIGEFINYSPSAQPTSESYNVSAGINVNSSGVVGANIGASTTVTKDALKFDLSGMSEKKFKLVYKFKPNNKISFSQSKVNEYLVNDHGQRATMTIQTSKEKYTLQMKLKATFGVTEDKEGWLTKAGGGAWEDKTLKLKPGRFLEY